MKKQIHRSKDRGSAEYGWLHTKYSFSFADWYEPSRMGFGMLRVLNDDRIDPANGFGAHSHRDMEIITIVLRGTVTHKDSMGNIGTVPAGDVQVMSAGSGVTHSEYNESTTEPLELFQIWIESKSRGIEPRYGQTSMKSQMQQSCIYKLVVSDEDPSTDGVLTMHQDASISRAVLDANQNIDYTLRSPKHGVYIFLIEGSIEIDGVEFNKRDAVGVFDITSVNISSKTGADILLIDVPM